MTGDINRKLFGSAAAKSLRMEHFVATCFRDRKWPAEQSIYYTDPETSKSREIDVISRHILNQPKRRGYTNGPAIHLNLVCECKSLSGLNVLIKEDAITKDEQRLTGHWSGYEDHTEEIIDNISSYTSFKDANRSSLYAYFLDRAYPDSMELTKDLKLFPPPVELIASAFRITRSGDEDDSIKRDPLWDAIRSVTAAKKAALLRADKVSKEWIIGMKHDAYAQQAFIENLAFIYDTELLSRTYCHPVIFCEARLFSIADYLRDIKTARLCIRNLDFDFDYVDIVTVDAAESYIAETAAIFEKQSRKIIRGAWNRLEALQWEPMQKASTLAKALGTKRARSNRK